MKEGMETYFLSIPWKIVEFIYSKRNVEKDGFKDGLIDKKEEKKKKRRKQAPFIFRFPDSFPRLI